MGKVVFDLIQTFLDTVVLIVFFGLLSGKKSFFKDNLRNFFIFLTVDIIFITWSNTFLKPGVYTILIFVFSTLVLSYLLKINIVNSLIINLVYCVFIIITEIFVGVAVALILHTNIVDVYIFSSRAIVVSGILRILQFSILIFFYKFKYPMVKIEFFKKNSRALVYVMVNLFVLGLIFANSLMIMHSNSSKFQHQAALVVLFLISIVFNTIDYSEREKDLKKRNEQRAKDEYVSNMESLIDLARKEKHEYANHLNTIQAICVMNKPDAVSRIKAYIEKLTSCMGTDYKNYSSGNEYIDGLLAIKSSMAKKSGISIEADFQASLGSLKLTDSDLISIFGNMIDNSIDAFRQIREKEIKTIRISTLVENNAFYISISNNGPAIPIRDLYKIFESGFSTKSEKKERGFGLHIIKQIVQANGGEIYVNSNEVETCFTVRFKSQS